MKKKIFISFIIIIVLLMIFGIATMFFIIQRDKNISLIQENVVIEYGNTYNPNIEELIDLSRYSFINSEKVRIESNIENGENKDYPEVGKYEINVYYNKKSLKQTIQVIDTTAPELSIKENIEIPFGTDLATYNFKELMSVSDLSEVKEYDINIDNVDSSCSGEYIAKVMVEDIYNNRTQKEFKVIIQEEKKETKEVTTQEQTKSSNSSKNSNEKKTTSNSKKTTKEDNSTKNSSSNTSKNEWTTDTHYGGEITDSAGNSGGYWEYGEELDLDGIDMSDWDIMNN